MILFASRAALGCAAIAAGIAGGPALGAQGIRGVALLGPVCPVEQFPPDPNCEDRPLATKLIVSRAGRSRAVRHFASSTTGAFEIDLPQGSYEIRSAGGGLPYCASSGPIVVRAGTYSEVRLNCDTGIR